MLPDLTTLWTLVVVADVALLLYLGFNGYMARRENPVLRFAFRLSDYWSAAVSFVPTFLLFRTFHGSTRDAALAPLSLALLLPHQCGGIFLFLLRTQRGRTVVNTSAIESGFLVFTGSLLGYFLPILSATLICALIIAILLAILIAPLALPAWLILHFLQPTVSRTAAPNEPAASPSNHTEEA